MLDLTPKTHQDYLSTFSLSRSTDTVIGVMTEVKIREDEYKLLKSFASRVQGLSASHDLATRERRLLHSGPLALVLSDSDNGLLQSQAGIKATSQQKNEARRSKRTSKFLDAVSISSFVLERSDSVKSASTSSSSTTGPVMTSTPVKSSWFSRLPLGRKARSKSPLPADPLPQASHSPPHVPQKARRTVNIHAFVFNDLVLLAQPSQVFGDEPRWILLGDLGVFKPLSIAEIQNKNPQGGSCNIGLFNLLKYQAFRRCHRVAGGSCPRTGRPQQAIRFQGLYISRCGSCTTSSHWRLWIGGTSRLAPRVSAMFANDPAETHLYWNRASGWRSFVRMVRSNYGYPSRIGVFGWVGIADTQESFGDVS